jgi:hypothetical protein
MNDSLITQIIQHLAHLPEDQQRPVLAYAQEPEAAFTRGAPGRQLLGFAGAIPLDHLHVLAAATAAGCEQISPHDW